MEFFTAVGKRRSYRGDFTDKELSEKDKEMIMQSALLAPSGMNKPTTHYVAISDRTIIKKLGDIFNRYGFSSAPFVVVVTTVDRSSETGQDFSVENYSSAVENLQLAVTALGYATVWTDGVVRNPQLNNGIRQLLDIDKTHTIRCVFPIGEPKLIPQPNQKKELTTFVDFI